MLKFGTFIAPYHPVRESPLTTYERDLELIAWCDRWGFDEAWVGEHHSAAWENIPDPAMFLAVAGQRTQRIRLGSGVVSLPYHHPLIVADRFVQLDYLTNGRAMMGVGPGALISDATMMGIDPSSQRPRMNEALGVIKRLLEGETVTHESEWFTLNEAALQILPVNGSMPLAVASSTSPSGMVAAGTYGVGVLSLGAGLIGGQKDLAAHWALAEKTAAEHGTQMRRDEWRLVIRAHLAPTREQAIAEVRDGREAERIGYFKRVAGLKNDYTLEQEIAEDAAIVGTPDDMIAALHRLQEVTGGFGGFLVLAGDWADRGATLRSYEMMARYVIPEFRGHLDPLRASYDRVIAKKRDYGAPAMAAIRKAYEDAGQTMPDDLNPTNLR
ncbi:LLM class flavin-dependent oxidoreductase [Mycolicibacterium sp. S2-37]|uniref:LLM class flavin-dependent oxidoreductase n=1 Tax=Mycolicibacterium sp. S2-37 TaxID=2810297 RepID=UPI001A93FDF4|nr:LLM class flavin-dependent oxidoreductase [Mycolicibacterium sp. S2-37]MBO0676605.1 LLM class flavin-dependent oxidoreductase [Mycolicibacterium sp. S2-37]